MFRNVGGDRRDRKQKVKVGFGKRRAERRGGQRRSKNKMEDTE
jgi:hypothetical protein